MNNMTNNIFVHILFLLRIFLLDVHYVACEFFAYLFCWHMGLRLRYNRTHMALFLADKTLFRLSKNSKDVSAFERLERLHILQGILLGKYYAPLAHGEPFLPSFHTIPGTGESTQALESDQV